MTYHSKLSEKEKKQILQRRLLAAEFAKKNPALLKLRDAFDLELIHPELKFNKK